MAGRENPYVNLGIHLKKVREQSKRSLSEVSGALEIDETELSKIEAGLERPDEDLMLLLISYFDMVDQEALRVWELAEYDSDLDEHMEFEPLDTNQVPPMAKPMLMLLSMEPRSMYSDGVEVSWNKAGITMEFSQATPKGPLSVSKIGMSYDQAAEVLKCLERAMLHAKYTDQKMLLPPKKKTDK